MTEVDVLRASLAVVDGGGYPTIFAIAGHLGCTRQDIYGKVCGAHAFGLLVNRYDKNQPSGQRDGHYVTAKGWAIVKKSVAA